MKTEKKINNIVIVICILAIISCLGVISMKLFSKEEKPESKKEQPESPTILVDFNSNFIKKVNEISEKSNYLISPYNVEIALNMLREGADGKTKEEIDKVIGNRTINDVTVKNKLNVANGLFIKNRYKNDVKKDFTNLLKNKYQAEILYDQFTTPDVINNWVSEKTNKMINNLLDDIESEFVLGIASALALDVKWQVPFECFRTTSQEFTKIDHSKINVEMMHNNYEYDAKYIKTDDAIGIILPYEKEENSNVELEFVGLIPNNGINDYINSLTDEKINSIFTNLKEANGKFHINLSLPRFTYEFKMKEFNKVLMDMGIKEVFNPTSANLSKMIKIDQNVYVNKAIHQTKIELNETGTKAAAVTYFGVDANGIAIRDEYEEVNVIFDKPFVYMIREKNTGEILFFGSIYEPNIWKGNTCSE